MKTIKLLIFVFFLTSFLSCKEEEKPVEETSIATVTSTFYLIRHAEKDRSDPNNIDPELTQKGLGRAMHWAEILEEVDLDAIYTTDFERTVMTASPTSVKKDITPLYYDPRDVNIKTFKSQNLGKNVLVVGHSNSTPDFANKLLGEEKYSAMDHSDNGSLFIVTIINEKVTSTRLHFDCSCPSRE
ncbi:SixA phosphatase family protein [Spongiimicrobium salis]|uniref:SixA phosphatase family protein n=1 Tax=Spongiimicrobium salis TaxID=1667022 RepID=UPI00374D34DE